MSDTAYFDFIKSKTLILFYDIEAVYKNYLSFFIYASYASSASRYINWFLPLC